MAKLKGKIYNPQYPQHFPVGEVSTVRRIGVMGFEKNARAPIYANGIIEFRLRYSLIEERFLLQAAKIFYLNIECVIVSPLPLSSHPWTFYWTR
jgi:hypothetical protein